MNAIVAEVTMAQSLLSQSLSFKT